MNDPRKEYIVQCIISVLNIPRPEFRSNKESNSILEVFLDDENKKVLQAVETMDEEVDGEDSKRRVTLTDNVSKYADGSNEMHFVKMSYEPLTVENISKILLVSSLRNSSVRSLFYLVREVFVPLLVKGDAAGKAAANAALEGNLGNCLIELDTGLNASLRRGLKKLDHVDENDLMGVLVPLDEIRFWQDCKDSPHLDADKKERAANFADALAPVQADLSDLQSKTFAQLLELCENLQEVLDSLWTVAATPGYPEVRMQHLLGVLAGALGRCIQTKLNGLKVWESAFSQVSKHIREGYHVCVKFCDVTQYLTGELWGPGSDREWKGGSYKDPYLVKVGGRIREVDQLRNQHDQIMKLLPAEDLEMLKVDACFEPFQKINAFSYNKHTEEAWKEALSEYDRNMSGVQGKIAERLRSQLFSDKANPAQAVRVFQRYERLLDMKSIREALTNERERLLAELSDFVGRLSLESESLDASTLPAGRGLSLHVRQMMCIEQLRSKADLASKPLGSFLKDLPNAAQVAANCKKVRQDLEKRKRRTFDDWKQEAKSNLDNASNSIALEMTGKVMEFDTAQQGSLRITYSEQLIQLVKEARMFQQMGCNIPTEVETAVQNGLKFYRFAVQLKQVCNFYNNLDLELLPSQKLMALEEGMAFEKLFTDKKSTMNKVSWEKIDQLELFTSKVKDSAERLRHVNRLLRSGHQKVAAEVVQLANISLLRQKDMWKSKLAKIQDDMDKTITASRCKDADTNARPWRRHWDHQIFKIMEIQYQFGLESLHEHLPQIKADLVLANKQLKLKPPLEELKSNYYKEIRSFISLPLMFKGLEGASHIYKMMPERNQEGIAVVFQKADDLFKRVQKLQESFAHWMVVGLMPERMQEMIDEMQDVTDWDKNFRALKAKRKELDRLPDSIKVDCFTISTVILKSVIEDQFQRLSDNLVIALKRKANEELKVVRDFLDRALMTLSAKPDSVQELGKAQTEAQELASQLPQVRKQIDSADEKNKLLKSVASGLDMGEVVHKFEEFQDKLEAFEQLATVLRDELKSKMDQRIQNMTAEISKFASRWQSLKPKTAEKCSVEEAKKNAAAMQDWMEQWDQLKEQVDTLRGDCQDFDLPLPPMEEMDTVEQDLQAQQRSWSMFEQYTTQLEQLMEQTWLELRPRLFVLQDLTAEWMAKLKEIQMDPVLHTLFLEVQQLAAAQQGFKNMTGEPFERDHWKILFAFLKLPADTRLDELKFGMLVSKLPLIIEKADDFKELTARAIGEVTIRDAVMEVSVWFEQTEFNFMEHPVKGGIVPLIKDWKDLMSEVSDKQSLCGSLKDSRYFMPFKDQVDKFEEKLSLLDELLLCMNKVQRKWVYLEPIFGRGSLPREKERFDKVNNQYRQIMKNVGMNKKVNYLCNVKGLKDQFYALADQLERCQKALTTFLEEKRAAFPRLYFIGDEDLLEILGQSSNPEVIQSHLKKLFAGIATVDFAEGAREITGMNSSLKEKVMLKDPVIVMEGDEPRPVEDWLSELSRNMVTTLAHQLLACNSSTEMDMTYFDKFPSQLLCLSANISFTQNVEKGIPSGHLGQLKGDLTERLTSMTSLNITNVLLQSKLKALILDLIHNIAVLDDLISGNVQKLSDWHWFRQLRYYSKTDSSKPCVVRMLECEQLYSFEYQGNAPKLVHTPLTDKCYLTLMHGLHLGYGGNPYGPAGTGKTESVKALGSCLGRQVLVFNCDEGIDFQAMGRIFIGLVRCGAWGCFDEFNRLLEEQMSAISQSVQLIQAAIKTHASEVELLGRKVQVNHNAGIFITMNPATKGYGGRQKLPDNLKQLFRPVAMSLPDNELIAEVMMFSEGFMFAKILAQKVVSLFVLSRQLLSIQQHYNWGLRELKPILTLAGRLLQETKSEKEGVALSEAEESILLLKAVRMNTLSKLTFADNSRFQALCLDLFPGVNVKDIEYKELEDVIRETMAGLGLSAIDAQISKMLQFHEACQQRMGVGIVGPSGCGKSTIWKVLEAAYKRQGKSYVVHVMNPKSMPRVRLLGHMDHDTREWFDGVLTASARKVIKESVETHNWIVCDGDIDPEWVESLNSVLDDNRLLTMPNGERIQFGTNVNFIFETDHLRFASPATISRLNMIFLSEEDIDVKPLVQSWIMRQPETLHGQLEALCDEIFYRSLDWCYKRRLPLAVETTRMGMVANVLGHMSRNPEANLLPIDPNAAELSKQEFLLAVCRGLGGNLSEEDRASLTQEVFKIAGESLPDSSRPLNVQYYDGGLCNYNPNIYEDTVTLKSIQSAGSVPPLVYTESVMRNTDLFRRWLHEEQPFIVCGPEGAGKNLLIRHAINRMVNEADSTVNVAVLNCNAQTSSRDVLGKLQQFCAVTTGTTGRIFRPKEGRRLIFYMKDINLPTPDKYDTSEIIMFLQQAIMHKGFYDDDLEFVQLEHIQIVASIAPSSTLGRHRISSRFTAIVRICSISYPTNEELQEVYDQMVAAAVTTPNFQNVADKAASLSPKVAEAMVDVYSNMKSKFTIDEHEHYLFSPRDLTQWVMQVMRYEVASVDEFLEVWCYEACRIFRDRLVGPQAQDTFDNILRNALIAYLGSYFNSDIEMEKLVFTSLLTFSDEGVPKGDMKKVSAEDYKKMIENGLRSFEREVKDLPIELVQEVQTNLACIDRALSAPRYNDILLVGRPGCGRRSALSLMAHMCRLQVFSPPPARKYGDKEWKRDLKQVMQMAGVEKQHTIFFLEDHHLLSSSFLESINSLLSAGDVPGIWTNEELEPLLAPLKEEFLMSQGRGDNVRTPFEYFVKQVRDHLRIVLSMDANHPHFLPFCAANPALFSCMTVMWLDDWSQQSKELIATATLQEIAEDKKANIPDLLMYIHETQATMGSTPRHFISLLQTCRSMYQKKVESSSGQSTHLQKGLEKLHEVSNTVEQLKKAAVEKQQILSEKQKLAEEALVRITDAMQQSAQRRTEVEQLEATTQVEQEKNHEEKIRIEGQLSEIQPILEAAKKAVGGIKPDHINEIRALKLPPEPIHDVLNGVLRLMDNHDNSWASMKKFLAGSGVIQRILNFDPRQISDSTRQDVEKLLKEKANSFEHATIFRVSVAAAPLAKWVVACVQYSSVLVKVAPMEKKLADATKVLEGAVHRLQEYQQQLVQLDNQVIQLKHDFEGRTREAEALRFDLEKATATLEKADALMNKMSGERDRWQIQTQEIQRDAELLSTYTSFAAAYCTYLGQYSEDVRAHSNGLWTQRRGMESFDFLRVMSSESELLTWKAQGLSADRLSQENAVMIKYSAEGEKVPFIVDPNSQAVSWLQKYAENAETVLAQDAKLVSQLELSVRFGKTIIIQEVDGIDNFLFPLLRRDLIRQGPRQVVQIGDKMCDFNEGFKMYLCTRNSNAIESLPPNAACLVTRVSFSVTRAGLEGQLLGTTLQHEKPELEHRKSELLQKEEQLKVELADLEKQLLTALADASGNILENEPLIQTLENTKSAASTISTSLEESTKLQVALDNEREVYRPLAVLGSQLFILIRELPHIDHMYRFSLEAFMDLFHKVLSLEAGSVSVEEKLKFLGNQLKIVVLHHLSRSLFKADRLSFGMHIVRGIMPEKFEPNEWELFQGTYVPPNQPHGGAPEWCPADRQSSLQLLRAAFPRIDDMWQLPKAAVWQKWVESDKCEEQFDPSVYSRMSAFQRVLLIQALRPDRLESALTQFACEAMGVATLSPPPLSLQRLHSSETSSNLPILFITTPGADPSQELEEFAKTYAKDNNPSMNFHQISMGGGQNDDALRVIQEASRCGDWVCLKNLHLVISWVPLLEKEIKNLKPHENFRCWLTTESHAKFPPILLETSLKVTYEAPPGVKKNMLRTIESWSQGWFGEGNELRSQVIFLCAHFHAIMQERRTYIPQGWTKFYEFSTSDLQSACETVSLLVKGSSDTIDWATLIGVLELAVYGSRVDNEFDSRLVKEYLALFFKKDTLESTRRAGISSSLEIPPFEIPLSKSVHDYRAKVELMPDIDNPQSFGMAPNSDRSLQRINSTKVIGTLRMLAAAAGSAEGGAASSAGVDVKAWKVQLGPLFQLWDNVQKAQISKVKNVEVRAVNPDDSPVVAFVLMDASEAGKLGDMVSASLNTMQKVIAGTALSTPDLIAEAKYLIQSEVPPAWSATWPSAPEDPAIFLQGLGARIQALKGDWLRRLSSGNPLREPVALSDFLRPDVFLNALRQQTARALKISIDSLHLVSSFESHLLSDASVSPLPVNVQGLILEGCSFNDQKLQLVEGHRSSPLTSVLPALTVAWMSRDAHPERAVSSQQGGHSVAMPIYVALSRERLIGEVVLKTENNRQRILNSAALFLTESSS